MATHRNFPSFITIGARCHPLFGRHPQRKDHRPLGLARGEFKVTPAFFEPLPDDILAFFNGEDA
jgi:hypothetical protein